MHKCPICRSKVVEKKIIFLSWWDWLLNSQFDQNRKFGDSLIFYLNFCCLSIWNEMFILYVNVSIFTLNIYIEVYLWMVNLTYTISIWSQTTYSLEWFWILVQIFAVLLKKMRLNKAHFLDIYHTLEIFFAACKTNKHCRWWHNVL